MNETQFLKTYLNNASPTGHEASGQQIWLDYIKPYVDSYFTDSYGTAVAVIEPDAPFRVVIEAHADEISWFVNYIKDDGYIYVRRNGGSDHMIAPSMRVNIHTDKGIVPGVFGWPAIHVRKEGKEDAPTLDNIFIDVGAQSKAEVEQLQKRLNESSQVIADLRRENRSAFTSGSALDTLKSVNERLFAEIRTMRTRMLSAEEKAALQAAEIQRLRSGKPGADNAAGREPGPHAEISALQKQLQTLESDRAGLLEQLQETEESMSRMVREKAMIEERYLELDRTANA